MHDGALEHRVGMKQIPERGAVVRLHVAVPFFKAGRCQMMSPAGDGSKGLLAGRLGARLDMHIDAYA